MFHKYNWTKSKIFSKITSIDVSQDILINTIDPMTNKIGPQKGKLTVENLNRSCPTLSK